MRWIEGKTSLLYSKYIFLDFSFFRYFRELNITKTMFHMN